jgi:hypothetical protein
MFGWSGHPGRRKKIMIVIGWAMLLVLTPAIPVVIGLRNYRRA